MLGVELNVFNLGDGIYELQNDISYKGYTIKSGFRTDFASTPKWIHNIFKPQSKYYSISSVFHDWLYTAKPLTRAKADKFFLNMMKEEAEKLNPIRSYLTRWIFYVSVRLFGGSRW